MYIFCLIYILIKQKLSSNKLYLSEGDEIWNFITIHWTYKWIPVHKNYDINIWKSILLEMCLKFTFFLYLFSQKWGWLGLRNSKLNWSGLRKKNKCLQFAQILGDTHVLENARMLPIEFWKELPDLARTYLVVRNMHKTKTKINSI